MIEPSGSPHQCEVDVSTFEVYKYFPDREDAIIGADCKHCDAKFIKIMHLQIMYPCNEPTCCATAEDYEHLGSDDSRWPCIDDGSVDENNPERCSKCGCVLVFSDNSSDIAEFTRRPDIVRVEWNQMERIWGGKIPSLRGVLD